MSAPAHRRGVARERLRALVYPGAFHRFYLLRGVLRTLGWEWTTDPDADFDFAVAWMNYRPQRDAPGDEGHRILTAIRDAGTPVVNYDVLESKKTFVDAMHREVLGYGTLVDPLTHTGDVVEKSNGNGHHDGRIVTCPLSGAAADPQKVYSRLIDSRDEHGDFVDLRVAVVDRRPTFVTRVMMHADYRFLGPPCCHDLRAGPLEATFAAHEIDAVSTFCDRFGLDFGDLDVLRDRASGRIHVVDVNPTSGAYSAYYDATLSAYERIAPENRGHCVDRMTWAGEGYEAPFRRMILERLGTAVD